LKALVIGYGSIGKRHISNLSKFHDIEISVVTSRNHDNFLLKNKCKIFKTIDDSLKENYDFCIISNASSLHVDSALLLVKHGVHLFIEKPLSNSLAGINLLLSKSKKQKLVTQIGCNLRFHPCLQKIKEMLLKNEIGNVYSIHIENGSFLPDWHPNEDYKKSYAAQQKMGGGVVLTCIHEIDYLYWFFGKIHEVFSITTKISDLKIDCEDSSSILMKVGKNTIAEIHLDYFQQPPERSCKIIGSLGTLIWNFESNTIKFYNSKKKIWTTILKLKKYNYNQMYVDELSHFIDCIKCKKASINPISDGIKILKIALAVKKSSKLKKMIKIE
jgi:predicted dehydrogenase